MDARTWPARLARVLAVACLVVPQAVLLLVQGAAPVLLREAPLLLLALHPVEPWSLLASPRIDAATFLLVVVAVRAPVCVGDYYVGRWYGERALTWATGRLVPERSAAVVRRWSGRGGPLLVLFPGATVSVLAGAARMPLRRFLPLILAGVVLAAVLTRVLSEVAAGPLVAAGALLDRWAVPAGVAVLLGLGLARLGRSWARRPARRAAAAPPPVPPAVSSARGRAGRWRRTRAAGPAGAAPAATADPDPG